MRRRLVGAAVALTLSGCVTEGVTLSPEETDLEACTPDGPLPTIGAEEVDLLPAIRVEDLPTASPVPCELAGWALVFPDGEKYEIGDATSSVESRGAQKSWVSLGVYGVVATSQDLGGEQRWWGTPEGIQKAQEADLSGP